MSFDVNSEDTQKVLAFLLGKPSFTVSDTVKKIFHEKDLNTHVEIISSVYDVFRNILEIKLEGGGPELIDRLRFNWRILRKADLLIRNRGKKLLSKKSPPYDVESVFQDILQSEKLHDCFLKQLCEKLFIDSNGGFIGHYYNFLVATKQKDLKISLRDSKHNILINNLKRLIWWIIRANRDKYVETDQGETTIYFPFLTDEI